MTGDARVVEPSVTRPAPPSARRIVGATLVALLVAAVVLVAAILPAAYGIDPQGTGRLLGLTALADVRPGVLTAQPAVHRRDTRSFILGPFQSVEYKYRIEENASMLFSWRATGQVIAELHSEPDGAPEGFAETFEKRQGTEGHGTFMAPFPGIHGWYWENVDKHEVTITLDTAGFYATPQEFYRGGVIEHELTDTRGQPIKKESE
jgi:hypothetical protein